MSRYKVIGLPGHEVDLIDNWVACAHAGKSVVPRDFTREVDRFEARPDPDTLLGGLVDAVYERWLRANRSQAQAIVALCFGGAKGRLRSLGLTRADADTLLRSFAREVGAINVDAATAAMAAKIPRAPAMRDFPGYRRAQPVPKRGSREWIDLHFKDRAGREKAVA